MGDLLACVVATSTHSGIFTDVFAKCLLDGRFSPASFGKHALEDSFDSSHILDTFHPVNNSIARSSGLRPYFFVSTQANPEAATT